MSKETYKEKMNKIYKDYIETRLKVIDDSADVVAYGINLYIFNDKEMEQHDKEFVAKVLEKVKRKVDNISMHNDTKDKLMIMCEEIQKEFEDGE